MKKIKIGLIILWCWIENLKSWIENLMMLDWNFNDVGLMVHHTFVIFFWINQNTNKNNYSTVVTPHQLALWSNWSILMISIVTWDGFEWPKLILICIAGPHGGAWSTIKQERLVWPKQIQTSTVEPHWGAKSIWK